MAYIKTNWVDDQEPTINAQNLNKIENELESLDNNRAYNPVLLWTNASPTSSFGMQEIFVDLSDYDEVEVYFMDEHKLPDYIFTARTLVGYPTACNFTFNDTGGILTGASRRIRSYANKILFAEGYLESHGGAVIENKIPIPHKIYGIKGV